MNTKFVLGVVAFIALAANATTVYDGACKHAFQCEPAEKPVIAPPPPPPLVFVCQGEVIAASNGVVECRMPDPEPGPALDTETLQMWDTALRFERAEPEVELNRKVRNRECPDESN